MKEFKGPDGEEIPHYTINIKDAWVVVEKLRNENKSFELAFRNGAWTALVEDYAGKCFQAESDIAPYAICLVAVKVKGLQPKVDELIKRSSNERV